MEKEMEDEVKGCNNGHKKNCVTINNNICLKII